MNAGNTHHAFLRFLCYIILSRPTFENPPFRLFIPWNWWGRRFFHASPVRLSL